MALHSFRLLPHAPMGQGLTLGAKVQVLFCIVDKLLRIVFGGYPTPFQIGFSPGGMEPGLKPETECCFNRRSREAGPALPP